MRAPVYRNIEEATTFLGLTFPLEVVLVFAAWFGALATLAPGNAILLMAATYVAVRSAGYGKPPGFVQHLLNWRLRDALGGGRLSAAARCRTPRLRFAPYSVARGLRQLATSSGSGIERASVTPNAGGGALNGPSRPGGVA